MTRGPATTRRLAGFEAAWTRFDLDVTDDEGRPLACEPVELWALADPESAIDTAALLRERVIADPPYWAIVWTGARAVAAVAASWPLPRGARLLDLGCGLGLSGIAAARRGANVVFGDYLDAPLDFVRASLADSGLAGDVRRTDFTLPASADDGEPFDGILAADIVYDPAHYAPLADFLDRRLAPGGTILLTESLRADATVFLAGMATRGFRDDRQALWVMEDGRRERTWLHVLARG